MGASAPFFLEVILLNNTATESKYNVTIPITAGIGVKGDVTGLPCFAETQVRMEITGVGPLCQIDIQGKIRNSKNWYSITTATGAILGTIDISTYDYIRYVVLVADGTGELNASGYMFTSPNVTPAGSATAGNQVISNNYLSALNNKAAGSLTGPIVYDDIQIAYPTSTTETYSYYSLAVLTATITITYSDSTKKTITRAQRT